jgi:octaprenyl-diphosphate synthase
MSQGGADAAGEHGTFNALSGLYAPIQADLIAVQMAFDAELASELPFVNEMCATVRSYRGKMLRPALLLLSGKAAGSVTPHHFTAAAVVEMVHMATLVHDDVLDGAELRRKRPTIAATEGNTAAVLLGDYLISHAFHLCSSLPGTHVSRRIGAITNIVCEGELMQNRGRGDLGLREGDYMEIIRRKTAVLTGVSCELGAWLAGADAQVVSRLYAFGEQAGIAFQIMDDVLDLVGDAEQVGKTLGRDLAQGKVTLPLIHALQNATEGEREALTAALRGDVAASARAIGEILGSAGSLRFAAALARSHVQRAIDQLDVLRPGATKDSLAGLAEFILSRAY